MITLTIDSVVYKLEYNLDTVRQMDLEGFDVEKIEEHKIAALIDLLVYAFRMHQPKMTKDEVYALLPKIEDTGELFGELVQMYSKVLESLSGAKGDSKNSKNWGVHKN